jgi:hypothetical protein|tara:strand:+ start:8 stop:211 length:204 start_codon:yes stop_codon:yes gene_type:complete
MSQREKGRKFDGISRPSDDNYRKNFDRIFGKKEKTLHEAMMEGYEEEKKIYEEEENGTTQKTDRTTD